MGVCTRAVKINEVVIGFANGSSPTSIYDKNTKTVFKRLTIRNGVNEERCHRDETRLYVQLQSGHGRGLGPRLPAPSGASGGRTTTTDCTVYCVGI